MKVVITGANGAVGQALLRCTAENIAQSMTFTAAVRSAHAAGQIRPLLRDGDTVVQISYGQPGTLVSALSGASAVIHLPGVLIERPGSSYEQANVETTRVVVEAAKSSGTRKIVLISATGASAASRNRYWRTKAEAENLVCASGVSYTILRVPLLLGRGTEGAAALRRKASGNRAMLIGGGRSLQQPLCVDDLARAAINATSASVAKNRILELAGPVSLTERELVERAARVLGRNVAITSIPKSVVSLALLLRGCLPGAGFSRDALEVITADVSLDPQPAATELDIALTGLDAMIKHSLEPL